MKKILVLAMLFVGILSYGQNKQELVDHYKAFYKEMKMRGDLQGVINGLTHLDLLEPSQAKKDTLAYLYLSNGNHVQALNVIGVDRNANDSDMALEVKAVSLKSIGQPQKAIEQFEALFKRKPSAVIAYELADLKTQLNDIKGAKTHVTYGIANSKDGEMRTFYETQPAYQVPLKAAFLYLNALITFSEDQTKNRDAALQLLDQALKIEPNFNMAIISKQALEAKKN